MSTSPNTKLSGFTLIELLVVLTIAGILATLVRPMFAAVLPGTQLKADIRLLLADLRASRSLAIGSGRPATLTLCSASKRYLASGADVTQLAHNTDVIVTGLAEVTPALDSICDAAVDDAEYRVTFYPDGSSNGARILLGRPNLAYAINIDWLTGQALISEATHASP
jgi:general secretion pathway protein H